MASRLRAAGDRAKEAEEAATVARETRDRLIHEAAGELGWTPGRIARAVGLSPSRIVRIYATG